MDKLHILYKRKLDNLYVKTQKHLNSLVLKLNEYILNLQTLENPVLFLHEFPAAHSLLSSTLDLTKRIRSDAQNLHLPNDSAIDEGSSDNNGSNNNDWCSNSSELTKLPFTRPTNGVVEDIMQRSNRAGSDILCLGRNSDEVQKKLCCCDNQQSLRSGRANTLPATITVPIHNCLTGEAIFDAPCESSRINACTGRKSGPHATARRDRETVCTALEKDEFAINRIRSTTLNFNEVHQMLCAHVSSPWDFWLQCYPSFKLKKMRNQIKYMYALGLLETFCTKPEVGSYVVGIDGDTIARGLVLKVTEAADLQQTSVKILDIDTGSTACFHIENIFILNDVLSELPAQAVNCELAGLSEQKELKKYFALCEKFVHVVRDSVVKVKIQGEQQLSKFGLYKYSVDMYVSSLDSGKSLRIMDYFHDELSKLQQAVTNENIRQCTMRGQYDFISENHKVNQNYSTSSIHSDKKDVSCFNIYSESQADLFYSNIFERPLAETNGECIKAVCNENASAEQLESKIFATNRGTDGLLFVSRNVVPCYIVSPGKFFVQIVSDESLEMANVLEEMTPYFSRNFRTFMSKLTAKAVIGNKSCACLSTDEKWYRAKVLNWLEDTEESLIVYFIDFGYTQVAKFHMIQQLPERYSNLSIYTYRCHLYGVFPMNNECSDSVFGDWDDNSIKEFTDMLQLDCIYKLYGTEFVGESLSVVLYDPSSSSESLNGRLVKRRLARTTYCQTKQPYSKNSECECKRKNIFCLESEIAKLVCQGRETCNDGSVINNTNKHLVHDNETRPVFSVVNIVHAQEIPKNIQVEITHVNAISEFFAVMVSASGKPDTLVELNKDINHEIDLENMKFISGMPVLDEIILARFSEDECWYRARILQTDHSNGRVKVIFIDYGNTEWVELQSMYEMTNSFCELPSQAIKCTSPHLDINNRAHFENMNNKFREIINKSPVVEAKVLSLDELGYLVVELFDNSGKNIFSEIQRLCH